MTGFNHSLAGCLVAAIVPPPLAPIVAFASHFLLDAMPHFGRDPAFKPYNHNFVMLLIFDAVLCFAALGVGLYLFPEHRLLTIVCTFLATLPDFMWLLRGRVNWLKGFFRFAGWVQWGERPWGWMLEVIYGCLLTGLLFSLA